MLRPCSSSAVRASVARRSRRRARASGPSGTSRKLSVSRSEVDGRSASGSARSISCPSAVLSLPIALKRILRPLTRKIEKTSSACSLMMFRQLARALARLTCTSRFRVPVSRSLRRAASRTLETVFSLFSNITFVPVAPTPFGREAASGVKARPVCRGGRII